jgi:hypothetical protein
VRTNDLAADAVAGMMTKADNPEDGADIPEPASNRL